MSNEAEFGFVQKELDVLERMLRTTTSKEDWALIWVARQALLFTLDPGGCGSPGNTIIHGKVRSRVPDELPMEGGTQCPTLAQ